VADLVEVAANVDAGAAIRVLTRLYYPNVPLLRQPLPDLLDLRVIVNGLPLLLLALYSYDAIFCVVLIVSMRNTSAV
jgi:hypothetical protein